MAVAYPKSNREKADLYFNALHEVRVRLRSIEVILASPMLELVKSESCHLQLRLCSECFSVACLAAQGDFQTHKAFRDDYSPISIFKALETLYPAFFPTPSSMIKIGDGSWHFDDIGQGRCITRQEIEEIWKKSGDHLHRASAKKYLKRTNEVDLNAIAEQTELFWNLIMGHLIVLADKTSRMHVRMDRSSDQMDCRFLTLDILNSTANIENYTLRV
jgi:hypothetical protein